MKLILPILLLIVFLLNFQSAQAQCNTNISICTPGVAGPFTFSPASPNPSSCLDYINGAAAPNYAYIILYITQGGDLNLLIQGDQAFGCLDVAIFDITGQADPCASLGLGTEIGCNYASDCDGCNEFGSNFPCLSEVPAPVVNTGDVIMILVEDWDPAQNSFTLELSNAPGSAQTGPPDPTITQPGVLCTTDAPIQMNAVNNGGTWTGTGVSATGIFDPSSVAPGTYNITYDIGQAPCDATDMTTVTVIDCSVGLPCPDYANTPTASNQACGGQLYDFEVANTACNGILTFDVTGNYGSADAAEITWQVTSNLTGNVVASGGPGFNGGAINSVVNVDPAIEGTFFTMSIFDSFGDGFNGVGGFFQIEQGGNIISGPVTGNFGTGATNIFGANISISTSTLTINTPSGPVTSTVGNCLDHDVQFQLDNANYCNPINVNLPWSIVCDVTGAVISSGTHAVTVYPQIPAASTDLIDITWNAATCQWDVVGQNDCDVLDIGNIFTITPDPTAWPANTCAGGNQDFTVEYIGVAGGPDCCSTGGPLVPITYNQATTVNDAVAANTPFGGTNNGAYTTIGPNGTGGAATALTLDIDMTGYCFPNVPAPNTDEYWITVIVDGNIVYDQVYGPPAPANANVNLNLGAIPGGYNQNSVVEVYVYPNFFSAPGPPAVDATYVPGVPCGSLNAGEWTAGTIDVTLNATFTEQAPTPANCTFVQPAAYTCCTTTGLTASNPATVNVQCVGDVPAADPLVVNDEAGPCNPVVAFLNDVSDGLTCPETITRTYRITNDCGDILDVQQLIVIEDTQVPVFAAPPADVTVECAGDVPAMINLGWTDNCDGAGNVAGNDVSDGLTCPETITRTWTYTDACGNTATETQIITVNDTQVPVFAAPPANVTVECAGDVPAMINLGWTDNCDGAGNVAGNDVSDGLTCPETITRTWTYTDACGNTATVTQTITVDDTTLPTASNPAPIAIGGGNPIPPADPLLVTDEADNCTVNPVVAWVSDVSDNGNCPEIITRTYSVTDDCGNQILVTQQITIGDAVLPTASNPADIFVQCIGDVPVPDPLLVTDEADNGGVPVVTFEGEVSDGLTCPETITRTYRVTDDCGNFILVNHNIVVQDLVPPAGTAPGPVAYQCIGDVPAGNPGMLLSATDNCTVNPVVAFIGDVSDGQTCPETITRSWTITDDCGNVTQVDQLITINDTQVPVLAAPPANVTVECAADIPAMVNLGWTDNCDGAGNVIGNDISDGQTCPETITRTWTYTDACGNTASVTQTITVDDTTPPTASNLPMISITSGTPIPPADPLVVNDEADNCTVNPVVAWVSDVSDNGNCPEIITRTYSVTDDCGNQITVTQLISIGDAVQPTASNPAPINVQCAADVPMPDPLVVTDEADNGAVPVVTFESDVSDGLSCPETITRTYRVTDDCGNFIFVTQTITVNDIQAPVLDVTPVDIAVQCIGDVPAMINLGWTDNCDGAGNVTGNDVSDGQSCPETITRTWTYTDACGNVATATQIITIHDTQDPVFVGIPGATQVNCAADIPAMINLNYTDNCDPNGNVVGVDVSDGQSCPETITRTWIYTDACGNTATATQIITVIDQIAPVLDPAPANANYQCIGDVPVMADLGWTDNCDGAGMVMGVEVSDGLTCPETITRTWTYTDACGNVATETQVITVQDTQVPVFAAAPVNVTVECAGDIPAMTNLGWTDNCDGAGVIAGNDVSDGQTCPETITRTWTYTDACGNVATETQIITVDDTTPPTASNPPLTVVPGGPVPPVDVTIVFDEADNCTANPTVTFVSEVSDNNPCPETITRTYEITDDCGNATQVTHIIQITDPILPTGTAPAPINVECIGDVPAVDPLLIIDEADNQGVPVVAHVGDVSDGQSCPETITRTYSITDLCGNQVNVNQIITVQDVTAPVLDPTPADVTVECIGDVPAMINLGWTDNCDGAGTVVGNDVSDGQTCPETITRTWTYTDACGNTATTAQIITVMDTQAPVFDAPPADFTIDCSFTLLSGNALTWTDNCDGTGAVLPSDGPLVGGTCGGTITRTWTYTDACGNNTTVTQIITVNDTQAPVLDPAPADVNVECIGDVPPMIDLGWIDNCDGLGTVTGNDVSDGLSCPETITRTWTYTDACGNTTTTSQTIVVNDVTAPTASNPTPISVPGANDVPAPDPLVVTNEADNCTTNPVVAWVSDVSDGNVCNGEIITRTYSVTDDCGNQTMVTQAITILATPAPIDAGNDTTICAGQNITIAATNPWGVPTTWSPAIPQGPFAPVQTTTYTVTANNEGCISTDQITVTVEEPPQVSFVGDVLTGCAPHQVTFTNTSSSVSGLADCEWTINGQTIPGCNAGSYTFTSGGTYDVTLTTTSNTGCTATETYAQYVYIEDVPNAAFTASQTELSSQFTEVNFTNQSTGATSYEWTFGEPGSYSSEEHPTYTYPQEAPASYEVTLTASTDLGCTSVATVVINVNEELIFWVPNTFTPDGDDHNDAFLPVFTEGYDPYDFHMMIFNRWGETIWESYDASVGWDGTYGQFTNEVQDGTYIWKIEFKTTINDERKMVTGHVNVIR